MIDKLIFNPTVIAGIAGALFSFWVTQSYYSHKVDAINAEHKRIIMQAEIDYEKAVNREKEKAEQIKAEYENTKETLTAKVKEYEQQARNNNHELQDRRNRALSHYDSMYNNTGTEETTRDPACGALDRSSPANAVKRNSARRLSRKDVEFLVDYGTACETMRRDLTIQTAYGKFLKNEYDKLNESLRKKIKP